MMMPMPAQKPPSKIFHATMLVTRAEEWWIEAATADEAQALLAAGAGHRTGVGERVHVQVQAVLEEADD